MIKEIKEKIKQGWEWIQEQGKKILIILGIGVALAASQINLHPIEYVTAPENNTYKIGVMNYDVVLNKDITADEPLKYQLDDKYISFKPISIRWDGVETKTIQPKQAIISEKNYLYKDAFGDGIDIDMNFGGRVFEKIVKIDSLEKLGAIPKDTKFLEIVFEVETNFIIDGWNKHDKFEITDTVRLGDFSYIEPAMAWDSYSEEVCWEEQVDNVCDASCTIEDEIQTGCDYCDPPQEVCETQTHSQKIASYLIRENDKLYLVKEVPIDWIKNAQFPIYTDLDITYGVAQEFSANDSRYEAIAVLDTNKFAVCYTDYTDGGSGQCIAATVSGTTITFGSQSEFSSDAYITPLDAAEIDTDKLVVCYTDDAADDDGFTRAVTVTYPGGVPTIGTWGTAKEFGTDTTQDAEMISCAQLNTDKHIICYDDETDSDTGMCVACLTSGTTISCGTPVDFATTDYYPRYTSTAQLETDKYVVCFEEEESGGDGFCVVGSADVLVVSHGTPLEFTANNAISHGVNSSETDKFVNCYRDVTDSNSGQCIAGTVSTKTITYGTIVEFDSSGAGVTSIDIDSTHFVVAYYDSVDSSRGKSVYSSVDFGTRAITHGSEEVYEIDQVDGGYQSVDIALISADKVVICYRNITDLAGNCIIGDTPSAEAPARRIIIIE